MRGDKAPQILWTQKLYGMKIRCVLPVGNDYGRQSESTAHSVSHYPLA